MTQALDTITRAVPKVISPRMHAAADYSTVASLFALGAYLRDRNTTASKFAYANASLVLLTSLCTDYPGGAIRGMSFRMHGVMDTLQAGMLALGPSLLGFSDTDDARLFYAHAALEMGVVAATDWDAAV